MTTPNFAIECDIKCSSITPDKSLNVPEATVPYTGNANSLSVDQLGQLYVGVNRQTILSDNVLTPASYGLYTSGPFTGNDGVLTVDATGLHLNKVAQAFTLTQAQGPFATLDHVKYLAYRTDGDVPNVLGSNYSAFTAPTDGSEMVYACDIACAQNPMPAVPAPIFGGVIDAYKDIRLSCAGLAVLDPDNLLTFDVLFSNTAIYAIYEHLPFLKPGWPVPPDYPVGTNPLATVPNDYHGFTHLIPLGSRVGATPLSEFTNVKICYNKALGYVRWLINDSEVYRLTNIGAAIPGTKYRVLDHNGPAVHISPNRLCFGICLFTLLDMHEPSQGDETDLALVQLCAPASQYVNPRLPRTWPSGAPQLDTTFLDAVSLVGNRIWGQGAQLNLTSSKIYLQHPV